MTSKDTHAVVLLGRITGVFGVKGWVKVFSYTQPRENIASFANWQIGREGRWRQAKVADCRVHGKGVIARLEGVDDRDEAAPLIGNDIGVLQADLPPCGEGEYYWNDLIGQEVVTRSGDVLGRVDHLIETGANDVLVVKGERERLIPFVQGEVVLEVDLETGRILVEWDPDF